MTLEEIANNGASIPLSFIGSDKELATSLQDRLGALGVLDPPSDGAFGPVSNWALRQVLKRLDITGAPPLDAALARLLLDAPPDLFPLNSGAGLAGDIVRALRAANHWICRHPDCVNIVYVEGMDPDGTHNDNAPNVFNDTRVVLRINRVGNPDIVEAWEGTTEPGKHFTSVQKLDENGAARIAFGQYKAWSVGMHPSKKKENVHEALVQTAPIVVFRDLNEDFVRLGDQPFPGMFGINQHWGYDLPKGDIKNASAGCLVGRTKSGHRAFMALCKADPRFQASNGYRFMTAVLPASNV